MLSQTQRNAIFTAIETSYTVSGTAYTAAKTYREHWSGEISDPIISLDYVSQTVLEQSAVGRVEWDSDWLSVDVYAVTDVANGIHGGRIVNDIARTLMLWFKQSADAALVDQGVKVSRAGPIKALSDLDHNIFRRQFDALLLYKLI